MKKKRSILWGIIAIVAAVLILVNEIAGSLDFLDFTGIPVIKIILGILGVVWAVELLLDPAERCAVFYPLAFLFIIFEKYIARLLHAPGEDLISTWLVIVCAVLLHVGTSALVQGRRKSEPEKHGFHEYSSFSQHIDCADISNREINVHMGNCDVYFENADCYQGGAVLTVHLKMGNATLHVPEDWTVSSNIQCKMGSVDIEPSKNPSGKHLVLEGDCKMGHVGVERK